MSAPAAWSAAILEAATGPPPTITVRRPSSFRNAGKSPMMNLQKQKARKF
jgi:hypothetical protein